MTGGGEAYRAGLAVPVLHAGGSGRVGHGNDKGGEGYYIGSDMLIA
jgi:hypothetical protein